MPDDWTLHKKFNIKFELKSWGLLWKLKQMFFFKKKKRLQSLEIITLWKREKCNLPKTKIAQAIAVERERGDQWRFISSADIEENFVYQDRRAKKLREKSLTFTKVQVQKFSLSPYLFFRVLDPFHGAFIKERQTVGNGGSFAVKWGLSILSLSTLWPWVLVSLASQMALRKG